MSPMWGHSVGVMIVVLMLVFIGIWIWAWLPHHRKDFDMLARMPMRDPQPTSVGPVVTDEGHNP